MRVPKKETLKELIEKHLSPSHPVRKRFAEIVKDIPEALIYGTPEQTMCGYDHDDVWIMMDMIQDYIGVRVEAKKK